MNNQKIFLKTLNELNEYLIKYLGRSFFPDVLDTPNIQQFKETLEIYFRPYEENENYEYSIRLGLIHQGIFIDEEKFNKHYKIIQKYITILLNLIKN